MVLSKAWYRSYFELPNLEQLKSLTSDFWKFINKKATTTTRIGYKICYSAPELGGFNAFNIEMKMRANLCSWKKRRNEGHLWCNLLAKHVETNLQSSRIRNIIGSWNRLQTVEDEDDISIIGNNRKLIDLNVATSKQIYQNIMFDDIPKEIVPKDNQNAKDLELSFRWIKKSKLNNITNLTILKLLHRKLYTEEEDGGVNVIFNTPYSKSLWEIIKSIWN